MDIVLIHGMNQQHYTAKSLHHRWLNLLKKGLNQSQQQAMLPYLKRHLHMAFYADLLSRHHLHNLLNTSTLTPQHWPHFTLQPLLPLQSKPSAIKQHQHQICDIAQLNIEDTLSFKQKLKFITALSKDVALRDFAVLINHFPNLHAYFVHKFLLETYLYLANPQFMQEVHNRIQQQLHGSKPQILVAHSLGSVIAYDYLIRHPELNIQRFITLGSPLAFRVIQTHLPQPILRPAAISGDWINFYSHDDFLTAFPLSEAPFDFQRAIINQEIRTLVQHPHDIGGYLQHPKVLTAVLELLKKST